MRALETARDHPLAIRKHPDDRIGGTPPPLLRSVGNLAIQDAIAGHHPADAEVAGTAAPVDGPYHDNEAEFAPDLDTDPSPRKEKKKRRRKKKRSTLSKALEQLARLEKQPPAQSEYFPGVTPYEFVQQLKERILDPDGLNQGKETNFCWASACMSYTYGVDPEGMVAAMCSLYTTGNFKYHTVGSRGLKLKPSKQARAAVGSDTFDDNAGLAGKTVDQMLFMTLAAVPEFKSFFNLDLHYDEGDEENAIWSGRSFGAAVRLWKAFGFDVKARGSSFSIKKYFQFPAGSPSDKPGLFEWAESELASNDIILFVYGPIFRQEGEKAIQLFATGGSHFIRVRDITHIPATNSVYFKYLDYGHTTWREMTIPLQTMRYVTHGAISVSRPH